jgi:hypothetical protein
MPKCSSSLSSFVKEFGEHVFSSDGKILFCKLYEVKVSTSKRFLVTQHLKNCKAWICSKSPKKTQTKYSSTVIYTKYK